MHEKPEGHASALASHATAQCETVPSLAQIPEAHAWLPLQVAPSPFAAAVPAMHAPS